MMLHPDDQAEFERMKALAFKAADAFQLRLLVFEAKRRPNSDGTAGLCYTTEGRISIVFRYKYPKDIEQGRWFKKPLAPEEVLHTVAHELAHLMYANHGPYFKELEGRIHSWLQKEAVK